MTSAAVTIVDIALALGISKTAVSSALHGSGRVSEATRQSVLAQAELMGYVSNRAAQRLRGGKNGAVGLYFPADVRELSFYMEFAFGVADVAATTGNDLLLMTSETSRRSRPVIDGLLVLDPAPQTFSGISADRGDSPIVTVGEYRGAREDRVSAWIAADHRGLTGEVLDQLGRRGVKRPAIAAIDEARAPLWAADVVSGYEEWCAQRAIAPVKLRANLTPKDDEITELLQSAERCGCDALLWVAQGIVPHALALQARGVGASLRLATMAAEPGPARVVSVDLRAREYGREAMQLLLRAIAGEVPPGKSVSHIALVVEPEA